MANQAKFSVYDSYSQMEIGENEENGTYINLMHSNILSVGKGGQILTIFIDSDRYN